MKQRSPSTMKDILRTQFYLAAIVLVWAMTLGFIVGGTALMIDAYIHEKAIFEQLTLSGISYVAGFFTTRITRVLDDD